jgi:hypothetical protein
MITFRISTDVEADRQVVLTLPPQTPLGKAELTVTVAPQGNGASSSGGLRRHFGAVHGGDPSAADNDRIDADLARAYGHLQE